MYGSTVRLSVMRRIVLPCRNSISRHMWREKGNRLAVWKFTNEAPRRFWKSQDFFRFFGLFRDVNLYGLPKIHVADMWAKASYAPEAQKGALGSDFKNISGNRCGSLREFERRRSV